MLSFMAMDYFQKSPVLFYPLLALGIFFTIFVGVTLRTMLTNKEGFDALARLPFDGDGSHKDSSEEARHV